MSDIKFKEFMSVVAIEDKKKYKEKYYQMKIQEAKDKKGIINVWTIIPQEVEDKIMDMKKEIEYITYDKREKPHMMGYINHMLIRHKCTMKSFKEFIFHEYENEDGESLMSVPSVKYNFPKFIWIMINKEDWEKEYYPCEVEEYKRITAIKTPSFEKFIEFRIKQKQQQIANRKTNGMWHCEYCDCKIEYPSKSGHLKSRKHITNVRLKNAELSSDSDSDSDSVSPTPTLAQLRAQMLATSSDSD